MLSTCPEEKNHIRANLQAWRDLKCINNPLRHVILSFIEADPYVIEEALTAEIFLEHVGKSAAQYSTFSPTPRTIPPPIPSIHDDTDIFLANVHPIAENETYPPGPNGRQ